MKVRCFFTVFILVSAYSFHVKAIENEIIFNILAFPEKKKLQKIRPLVRSQTFFKLSQASSMSDKSPTSAQALSMSDKSPVSAQASSVSDKSSALVKGLSMSDKSPASTQASLVRNQSPVLVKGLSMSDKSPASAQASLVRNQSPVLVKGLSMSDKSPASTQASLVRNQSPVLVKGLSMSDKSPASAQASLVRNQSPASAQTSSVSDKSPASAQASLVRNQSPVLVKGLSMSDKSPASAQTSSVSDKSPASAQASSMSDKSPASAQTSSMSDKSPASAQTLSVSDKSPASAQTSSVSDKNPALVKELSMKDKNPDSEQAPSKEAKESTQTDIVSEKNKNLESAPKSLDSADHSDNLVQNKIEDVLKEFIVILQAKPVQSEEYKNAVAFLERSLYDQVSFNSLKVLSEIYEKKADLSGHLKVVKRLSVNYPERAESFYLLGKAHKKLSETIKDDEEFEDNQSKIIAGYHRALKLDPKHIPSYNALLEELMESNPDYPESKKHTRASLNLVMEMLKNLKDNKYYILLCEAYYDNKFIRQTRRACVKSMRRNSKDPISPLILSLSLSNESKRQEKLLLVADKHPDSFPVQYRVGLHFRENSSGLAIAHLLKAHKLSPDHLRLNQILAWLLFRNNREEKALPYFLKSCLLTEGGFLADFRRAHRILSQKKNVDLVIKFNKSIKECYQKARQKNLN